MQPTTDPGALFYVEAWPDGGWAVKLDGHRVPVSRHDTEDEADTKADAYKRGIERARRQAAACPPTGRGALDEPQSAVCGVPASARHLSPLAYSPRRG